MFLAQDVDIVRDSRVLGPGGHTEQRTWESCGLVGTWRNDVRAVGGLPSFPSRESIYHIPEDPRGETGIPSTFRPLGKGALPITPHSRLMRVTAHRLSFLDLESRHRRMWTG